MWNQFYLVVSLGLFWISSLCLVMVIQLCLHYASFNKKWIYQLKFFSLELNPLNIRYDGSKRKNSTLKLKYDSRHVMNPWYLPAVLKPTFSHLSLSSLEFSKHQFCEILSPDWQPCSWRARLQQAAKTVTCISVLTIK